MTATDKAITVVGPKETVDFPDLGVFDVPAKIDTGADSSAVWASDIREKNGILSFVLFDKMSPYYTGQVLQTKKFSVASIKNSFGAAEFRYKVSLRVRLAGRTIRVRFTLANRENNSQPILVGRRTLHGKFLVDVAAKTSALGPYRMLLMSNAITPSVSKFVQAVTAAAENLEITHATYDDVQFYFGPQGTRVTLLPGGEDIASYNIVHFKTARNRDVSAAMARYLQKRGVKIVDDFSLHYPYTSKLYQYAILADGTVAIPDSLYLAPSRLAGSFGQFSKKLGMPFVLKGIHASKGEHNYLIRSEADYLQALQGIDKAGVLVIGQRFIDNTGDYRILVLGSRIYLAIHRSRLSKDTHLNNTSQGGAARSVAVSELPTAVQTASITAAKAIGLGVAGVDMVEEAGTGEWYCLEVNDGPQIASGAFVAEKQQAFARYIETELSK